MKIKLLAISLVTTLLATNATLAALPRFQAGDIQIGTPVTITTYDDPNPTGVASYFIEGTQGEVKFTCELLPVSTNKTVTASLWGGKNFNNQVYAPIPLHEGLNGPFVWKLTPEGQTVGNIKIALNGSKASASLRCVGGFDNSIKA